ncbi:MAG: hypothetical protein IKL96_02150 [Kiritimatiellae bacterium]|nr:hypothetical protein [Kiritimatiellia bacterium]
MDALREFFRPLPSGVLLVLLGACVAVAVAWFVWNRILALAWLAKCHNLALALLLGAMAAMGVHRGFAKLPQNYGIEELWNYGNEALGIVGEAQFHNATLTQLHNSTISESDVSNGWRVVDIRENREIVGRDSFANPQIRMPWLLRGGYEDAARIVPSGWTFPWRDGIMNGITVLSRGEIRPDVRTRYFPQPFEEPLAVVPSFNWNLLPGGVSNVFWHAVSPSNSLVVTWENSPVNRDVNTITNFQAEFFVDGCFAYRYQDHAVEYAPVFPFDWDGDGLENSVDPEPLIAGPDAHGTNVEWYNNVCSNVYEAAEGGPGAVPAMADTEVGPPGIVLSPRTSDVNTNAYYFVEVVASRGPAPIYFTADRESRLGSPVVVARGGETNHVPLLMGIEYAVTSTVPFSVSAPSNAVATMAGFNDGRAFNVKWPLLFDLTVDDDGYAIDVGPFDPGGTFSWGTGGAPHLLGGPPATCHHQTFSNRVAFVGCGDCNCGGATVNGQYCIENATFGLPAVFCQCMGYGGASPQAPMDPDVPHFEVSFSRPVVIFEDAYETSPGIMVGRRSTDTALSLYAYGGTNGATVTISTAKLKNLATSSGSPVILPERIILSPYRSFCAAFTCEGVDYSVGENDVRVQGILTEGNTGATIEDDAQLTAIRLDILATKDAPQNKCIHRHKYGIGEKTFVLQNPASPEVHLDFNDAVVRGSGGSRSIEWGLADVDHHLRMTLSGVEYIPQISIVKPSGIVGTDVHATTNGQPVGVAGGIALVQRYRVLPLDVLFDGIYIEEVPCYDVIPPTGYFAFTPPSTFPRSHTRQAGAGKWLKVQKENYVGEEKGRDSAMLYGALPRMMPDGTVTTNTAYGWLGGSLTWKVPFGWGGKPAASDSDPIGVFAEDVRQVFTITPQGDLKIEKLGHSAERKIDGRIFVGGVEQFNVSGR